MSNYSVIPLIFVWWQVEAAAEQMNIKLICLLYLLCHQLPHLLKKFKPLLMFLILNKETNEF